VPADRQGDRFVIQEHHARALHWDFRLERDGVLVSWALPKGLPNDPKVNHLAVHTEDHPMEYLTFAGKIPAGEYGGGGVSIWDSGRYETVKWQENEVMVVLDGGRAHGRFVLFRTKGDQWMIHRMDALPRPDWQPMPKRIPPMLATLVEEPPRGDDWAFEMKWDGVRAVVYVDGGRARVMTRNDLDVRDSYPELGDLAASIGSDQVILDGEIVALDAAGRPDFGRLQQRMHVTAPTRVRSLAERIPVTYLIFDLLYSQGTVLLDLPYTERRAALERLRLEGPHWAVPPAFVGTGQAALDSSRELGLEGVVAKSRSSKYQPGRRSRSWLKIKNIRTQEVVVCGWTEGTGNRADRIGALLLGIPDEDGDLGFVGKVGTGFTEATLEQLAAALRPLARQSSPFAGTVPRPVERAAHWVEPDLVGEVAFSEWTTGDARLRHPRWRGLRPDKSPAEVVRET
jgi:bifunctional non-homologous end joining protein LigD